MKFLCGNCKAKYQIADEKASGRTLRMKCRRCGHDILIDGHTMPAPPSVAPPPAPPAPARRQAGSTVSVMPGAARGGSGVAPLPARPMPPAPGARVAPPATRSKPPVSLSQDFRRHIAAPPEVPQRNAPYDMWHVAIQDVPVGPMTRDELGRKIGAGAVSSDSLCWREGMDDWRPLGELPELAQLLRTPRGDARSNRPAPARGRVPPPVVPAPPRPTSLFPGEALEEIDDEGSEPTRIADMTGANAAIIPGGSSMAQPGAGTGQPRAMLPQPAAQSVLPNFSTQSMPQEVSVAAPLPRRERMSGSTGLALGLLVGILIVGGPMLYRTFWVPVPVQQTAQASAAPIPDTNKTPEAKPSQPEPEVPEIQGEVPDGKTDKGGRKISKQGGNEPKPTPTPPKNNNLTDEQKKMLARMGGGSGGPDLSGGGMAEDTPRGGGGGPALTAQQLTGVVQNNKVQLQRCYESALRQAGGSKDTIKITVAVTVGESGLVKSVATRGTGLGGMNRCMESAVKRWRFPSSGGESEFEFPLVFQPGA